MRIIRIRIKVCGHKFIVLFSRFFNNFLNILKLPWYIPYSRKYQSFLFLCISFCSFFSEHKFEVLSCVSAHNIAPQFYLLTFLFRGEGYLHVFYSLIYVIMHSEDRYSLYSAVYLSFVLRHWHLVQVMNAFITGTMIATFTNYVTIRKLASPLRLFKLCLKVHSVIVSFNLILFTCSWFLSAAIFLFILIISNLKSFYC